MKRARFASLLLALATVFWVDRSARAGDPNLVWQTIETGHFRIHAHKGLERIARRVAGLCEDIHVRLSPALGWKPTSKTEVLLTDDTDSANGSATSLPFNAVRLFVTAPDDLSALNDYDDWLLELVTHEYTHILHTDNITGIPAIYNAIFGKQYSPNQLQPRWILEGLAVLMETRYTSGGRNRSTLFDMYLRADVLGNNIAKLDQISHLPRRWPQGNLWYLYGSHFLEWIEKQYGEHAFRSVAADYGDQIIPYGLNRAIHRVTKKTYPELYEGWIASMKTRYAEQKKIVESRGLREGKRLTFSGQDVAHPRYVPPQTAAEPRKIAFYRNDGYSTAGIYVLPSSGESFGTPYLLSRTSGTSTPAFLPDGSFVYDSVEVSKLKIYYYWDLFFRGRDDVGNEFSQGERLSFGLRANEPAVSPDGSQIAYVVNKQGSTFLYVSDFRGRDGLALSPPKKLVDAENQFDQIYTPRWSPDGKTIAFSSWRVGGYRDIRWVDVSTGRVTELTRDRAIDSGPVFSPDGRRLYFSSDRTGISNIYAIDLPTRQITQVTNVLGGAFQPDVSADGKYLTYLGYTHLGHDLYELEIDPSRELPALDYVDDRPPMPPPAKTPELRIGPYSPWGTLRPYTWAFELKPDSFGQAVTVSTQGADLANMHAFSIALTASFSRPEPSLDATYVYRNMPWDTRIRGYRIISGRGGYRLFDTQPTWVEETVGLDVAMVVPLNRAFTGQSVSVGYSFGRFHALDGFPKEKPDPYSRISVYPETGHLGTIRVGWSWNNIQRFLWSIGGGAKGFALSAGVEVSRQELASDYNVVAANYQALGFIPAPWSREHTFAFSAQGGASLGNLGRRGAFGVGGYADIPLPDAVRNLLFQPSVTLRGYAPNVAVGDAYQLFATEYRFPIVNFDRGVSTLPFFVQRLYGNVFANYGDATFNRLDLTHMKFGFGAELFVDFTVGYFQSFTLRVGLARGTSEGGETQFYTVLAQPF